MLTATEATDIALKNKPDGFRSVIKSIEEEALRGGFLLYVRWDDEWGVENYESTIQRLWKLGYRVSESAPRFFEVRWGR